MNTLISIFNNFKPEIIIFLFIVISLILSFFIKQNGYKIAKITSTLALITAGIFIIFAKVSTQSYDFNGLFVSNIYTTTFKGFILVAAILTIAASHNLIREKKEHSFKFFSYFLFGILSSFLLISSADLISGYISAVLINFSVYKLLAFRGNVQSKHSSLIYMASFIISNILMLTGCILLYKLTGNTYIIEINKIISVFSSNLTYTISCTLLIFSFLVILGLIPAYNNLINIFENTSSGICLYISLIPVIAYIAFISRLFVFVFAENPILQIITILSILITAAVTIIKSINETNIKRIYAIMTIINCVLFMTAICSIDVYSLSTVIFGIFVYIFTVAGMWSASIILRTRFQSDNINSYTGLFKKRPYFTTAFLLCIVAMVGFPPTGGFIARLYEFIALSRLNIIYLAALAVLIIIMIMFLFTGFRIIRNFFKQQNDIVSVTKMFIIPKITLYICTIVLLCIFVMPERLIKLSQIISYYI